MSNLKADKDYYVPMKKSYPDYKDVPYIKTLSKALLNMNRLLSININTHDEFIENYIYNVERLLTEKLGLEYELNEMLFEDLEISPKNSHSLTFNAPNLNNNFHWKYRCNNFRRGKLTLSGFENINLNNLTESKIEFRWYKPIFENDKEENNESKINISVNLSELIVGNIKNEKKNIITLKFEKPIDLRVFDVDQVLEKIKFKNVNSIKAPNLYIKNSDLENIPEIGDKTYLDAFFIKSESKLQENTRIVNCNLYFKCVNIETYDEGSVHYIDSLIDTEALKLEDGDSFPVTNLKRQLNEIYIRELNLKDRLYLYDPSSGIKNSNKIILHIHKLNWENLNNQPSFLEMLYDGNYSNIQIIIDKSNIEDLFFKEINKKKKEFEKIIPQQIKGNRELRLNITDKNGKNHKLLI